MFEQFTERSYQTLALAREEARRLNQSYIGTEHLLLGLLREGEGVAARTMASLGITLPGVRERVGHMDGNGGTSGDRLPRRPRWSWRSVFGDHSGETTDNDDSLFTAHLRRVLELARREALQLEHDYINTEHLLLGLLRESESDAVRVLFELHVGPEQIRREIMRALGVNEEDPLDQVESGGSY